MLTKKSIRSYLAVIFLMTGSIGHATTYYWISSVSSNWNIGSNWSISSGGAAGSIVPTSADIAIFDGARVGSCTITAAVDVAGINVQSGYSGTITQGANTITIGTSNALFSAGTFTGGTAAITCNGTFTLQGTSFTSTGNTLTFNSTVSSTSGTFVSGTGTVTFAGAASQTIPAWNYYNLTSSGTGARVLAASGTIGISEVFTKGTNVYTNTGSTINYNGTRNQTIVAFNYNNLTISGARTIYNITLASSGTIGVASVFSNTATFTSGSFVVTGSTVNYNGTGAQTIIAFNYNHLTISGARTINSVTLANSGVIIVAGAFTASATFSSGAYVITGSTVNYSTTAAQSIAAFNYDNLSISGARTTNNITLASTGVIGIAGTFSNTVTFSTGAFINTGSTINYNGTGQQTVIAFDYNSLTLSGTRTSNNVILASSGTIKVARVFLPFATFTQGNYITTGSTMEFNGTLQQTIPPVSYNHLVTSSSGERNFATTGTTKIAGTLTKGTNAFVNNGINGEGYASLYSKVATNIACCTAIDANTAFSAGDNGVILKTTDGGTSWLAQTSGTTIGLRDIEFYDSNNGLVIGSAGLVLRTTNGGSSWSSATPTTQTLSGIYYMSSSNVLITCANGTVIKSTDGGATWGSPIATGTTQGLYGMSFIHPDTGYVVGNLGVVYKTVNGGSTWTSSSTGVPTTYLYGSVYFTDRNNGYAVGYNSGGATGIIIRTTNGGATWTTVTTSGNYYGTIGFVNSTTGYICGGHVANNTGSMLVTRDGGATWTTFNVGTYRLAGMEMFSSGLGFVSGLNGSMIKVTCCSDGGTVEFNGSGLQRIVGTTTNVKFHKLKINKSAGKLLLANPVEIDKQLVFTKGIIGSSAANYLQFNNACDTVSNPSDSTYVSGPVKKAGNQAFLFPLGDTILASGGYHPLAITAPSVSTDAFTGQYFAANQTVGSALQPDSIENLSTCEYFSLNRNAGTSTVVPTIGWNSNMCNMTNYADLRVAGWDGTQWKSMGNNGGTFKGSSGTLKGVSGLNLAVAYITFASKPEKPLPYFILKRTLDAGYGIVRKNTLKFKFDEEYHDTDGLLEFTIYNDNTHTVKTTNLLLPSPKSSDYGEKWYTLNLWDCAISPTGIFGNGYYILEVKNEKKEKWLLRFKQQSTGTILCTGTATGVFIP